MTAPLVRPAHWDDPDPVPGFRLLQRCFDLGGGVQWEAMAPDGAPVLLRLVELPDDAASRAKAARLAGRLPLLAHPDLEPVRQVVPTADGLALIRPPMTTGVTTLSVLLSRRRSLSTPEITGLADRLGRALGYLHDNGVTHGRISAGDVLLRPNGRPVLTGFGVAGIQGAGGLPAADIAALATLLLSVASTHGGRQAKDLRAVLATVARDGADGHAFADEVLGRSDPAPVRLRPVPGREFPAQRSSPFVLRTSTELSAVPSTAAAPSDVMSPPALPRATGPAIATLDAAVRALRADARLTTARRSGSRAAHRTPGRPQGTTRKAPGTLRRPRDQQAQHLEQDTSRRRKQAGWWLSRMAPAVAILVILVLVGWRFLGSDATADAQSAPSTATAPWPDFATIARLDAARSAAFAAGAIDQLSAADAPGSPALAADTKAMSIMLSHSGRARGLAPRLLTVTALTRTRGTGGTASMASTGATAVVRVVDELPPYDFVSPSGQIIARSPGHPRQAHDVELRLVRGQWRYEAVRKPVAPLSSGKTS